MKKIILLILFPVLTFGQANDNSMIGTNIGLDLAYIKRELSMPYKSNRLNIDGNKYFFKKPSNATLVLTEEETPVNVITNYKRDLNKNS